MIAIIDYGLGNLTSVKNMLDALTVPSVITDKKTDIEKASGIIFPGVGAAGAGMINLRKKKLDKVLIDQIQKGKPFLGTCLGMQLLFEFSEEDNTSCLGIFKGKVKRFTSKVKIPEIGWNTVRIKNYESRIMKNIREESYFYFVNSFYCVPKDKSIIAGETEYGTLFPSVIENNNIFATQFHSEKSGKNGLKLMKNFIDLCI